MNNWSVYIFLCGRWQLVKKEVGEEEAVKTADEYRKYYNNKYKVVVTTYDLRFVGVKEETSTPWWKRLWK